MKSTKTKNKNRREQIITTDNDVPGSSMPRNLIPPLFVDRKEALNPRSTITPVIKIKNNFVLKEANDLENIIRRISSYIGLLIVLVVIVQLLDQKLVSLDISILKLHQCCPSCQQHQDSKPTRECLTS